MIDYYEIYVNKFNSLMSYIGVVKVLNETSTELISQWCNQKLGERYYVFNKKLLERWKFQKRKEDDRIITTIQRKQHDNRKTNKEIVKR